ncbi:MAG: hypothetical protein IT246_10355 [Bacteroidia bacterium]|nr:hypothetical protein [Bacteroidia bacterium]
MKIKFSIVLGVLGLISLHTKAQVIDDVNGKTYYYYDSLTNKKVKEIFHHIQEFKVMWDASGNERDTMITIKNGPYTRYYESGKLNCSGFYDRNKKTGTWKYYSEAGKIIRSEQWQDDKMIKIMKM